MTGIYRVANIRETEKLDKFPQQRKNVICIRPIFCSRNSMKQMKVLLVNNVPIVSAIIS